MSSTSSISVPGRPGLRRDALGAGTAAWLRVRDAARYQTLGRVVLDEA